MKKDRRELWASEHGYKPQLYEKEITIYKKYPVQQKYPDRYVTRKLLNWQCHHHGKKLDKQPVGPLLNSQFAAWQKVDVEICPLAYTWKNRYDT